MIDRSEIRNIVFNEALHKYTDEKGYNYKSVTTLIGEVEQDFNTVYWAVYRALDKADYKPRPFLESNEIECRINNKRYKMPLSFYIDAKLPIIHTANEIQNIWKQITTDSCIWGNSKHKFLEDCVNAVNNDEIQNIKIHSIQSNRGFKYKITTLEEFKKSELQNIYPAIHNKLCEYLANGWTIYAEKRVYHSKYRIAGTIDILLVRGNQFLILDWKTNKKELKFKEGYYKKVWNKERTVKIETDEFVEINKGLKFPLTHLPASKGTTYTLQLSLYALIVESWGLECTGLILCHFRSKLDKLGNPILDNKNERIEHAPKVYQLTYLKQDCTALLNHHYSQLIN